MFEIIYLGLASVYVAYYAWQQRALLSWDFLGIIAFVLLLVAVIKIILQLRRSRMIDNRTIAVWQLWLASIGIGCIYLVIRYMTMSSGTIRGIQLASDSFQIVLTALALSCMYLLFAGIAYSLGTTFRSLMRIRPAAAPWLLWFIDLALGVGVIMALYYILTVAHQVVIALPLLIMISVACLIHQRREVWNMFTYRFRFTWPGWSWSSERACTSWLITGSMLVGSIYFFHYYTPINIDPDDWRIYLNIAQAYITHGGYVLFSLNPLNQSVFNTTYLLMPWLQLFPRATNLINLFFFFTTYGLFVTYIHHRYTPRTALIAALLLSSVHMMILTRANLRPEALMLYLITLVIVCILEYRKHAQRSLLILSALLLGTAFGTKYNALLVIPAIAVLLWFQTKPVRQRLKESVLMVAITALTFIFWSGWNVIQFHNPLYPFFSKTEYHYHYLEDGSSSPLAPYFIRENESVSSQLTDQMSGLEKIVRTSFQYHGWASNFLGPLVLLLGGIIIARKQSSREVLLLILSCLAVFILWDVAQINHFYYIFFLYPWIALCLAFYLNQFTYQKPIVVLLLMMQLFSSFFFRFNLAPPLAAERARAFATLRAAEPFANAQLANQLQRMMPNYILLVFQPLAYHQVTDNHRHIYSNYQNTGWFYLVSNSPSDLDLRQNLRAAGITHLLTDGSLSLEPGCSPTICPINTYLDHRLRHLLQSLPVVAENNYAKIYEIPQ